ncbi:MAG: helix-turn-helix transcriptional regulator [Candidatus Diapherotrites archaeon]|uniref:Helix-turn-helix transcriptional regulator n=1 Tax=Candidatus Iainarchaeum sp. TaxID=3101447 RepID=A0A8T3YPS0_9ARCH|nr:helix-turn-helix transcriptional regulator [Candidatus Diapherotrites archaeon]
MERQRRATAFKIVIRRVEQPFKARPVDELEWICQSLGFLEPIDRDKVAVAIFKEIVRATDSGEALTSSAIAERVGMSRGAVINHLNNLMRSGLIVRSGRYYSARSRSIYRTIEEIEEDIERIFAKMKKTAMEIDEELLGVSPRVFKG